MKEIKLTQGLVALIDDEDYEYLNQFKWCAQRATCRTERFYAVCRMKPTGNRTIYMHRFILNISDSNIFVDHADHNGLNNQKHNLRECNNSGNQANQLLRGGTSLFKGIYFDKNKKLFHSKIFINGTRIHLGYFKSEIEAAEAYDKAAKVYFKEFALLNFP